MFILCALALSIVSTQAQNKEGSQIPLDHFYVERKAGGGIRKILKNFTFGANTGYGNTSFSHKLDGFGIYQLPGAAPEVFITSTAARYSNWINQTTADNSAPSASAYVVNPGTSDLGFKANALNIPLNLFLFYGFNRYRIGAGYSFELMSIGSFKPTTLSDKISSYQPPSSSGIMTKYYLMLGASFYRLGDYLFTGDLQIGSFSPGSNFSSSVSAGTYFNLGVTVERDLSEYFKLFARPSYEFKSYTIPVGSKSLDHSMNAFYLSIGITYKIPELPRCFLKDCHAQINHAHGNKEYRSRRHAFFKKQNPGYGENDKTLIKYRGKNNNKLNPY